MYSGSSRKQHFVQVQLALVENVFKMFHDEFRYWEKLFDKMRGLSQLLHSSPDASNVTLIKEKE